MPAQAKGKKSKKTVENLTQRLALVMKSGKSSLGYKSSMKQLRQGRAKLVIVSSNIAPLRKSEIEYYCQLAKVPVFPFKGTNSDLGTACGKFFRVSMMTVLDAGDSDLLKNVPK